VRILFARNLYRPIDLGGNRYPYEVTKRLAARGHEVLVVTGGFPGHVGGSKPRVLQYPVSRAHSALTFSTNAVFGGATTAIQASSFGPDVVVTSSYDIAYGYGALRLGTRKPTIFIYHSAFYSDWTRRLARRQGLAGWLGQRAAGFARHVERRVLHQSDRVVAVSPFSLREISAVLGPNFEGRSRLVHTGVDTQLFSPGSRAAARAALGLSSKDVVLATVGRLAPVKRYERAVHAAARLTKQGVPVTLLVIGEGPERQRLEKLAHELGANGAVRFEGHRDGAELVTRLRAVDLQLCTS
jgi:glycosyltransferase involved in cell wall biosynthesis